MYVGAYLAQLMDATVRTAKLSDIELAKSCTHACRAVAGDQQAIGSTGHNVTPDEMMKYYLVPNRDSLSVLCFACTKAFNH